MAKKQNTKSTAKRGTKRKKRRVLRTVALTLTVAALGIGGVLGWQWMTSLRCQRIELAGLHHADSTALMELAQVDTAMALFDIDPAIVADRVRRHPWVRTATATRWPTGTLRIAVQERAPRVLVMDRHGRPAHYLDRAGFAMPLASEAVYDLPLVRGLRQRYHPVQRLPNAPMREFLDVFARLDAQTNALVSELEIEASGELRLHTTPTGARGSFEVWLGRDGFEEKLRRLKAFWQQAVLPQPDKSFFVIDLRFDGQIVTRKASE